MKRTGTEHPAIVLISSVAGIRGLPVDPTYAVSKAGVIGARRADSLLWELLGAFVLPACGIYHTTGSWGTACIRFLCGEVAGR